MKNTEIKESVLAIFRTFKDDGNVIALFPYRLATYDAARCESYMHTGQHGAASTLLCFDGTTRPATQAERDELTRELERIGYNVKTGVRVPRDAYRVRVAALKEMQSAANG